MWEKCVYCSTKVRQVTLPERTLTATFWITFFFLLKAPRGASRQSAVYDSADDDARCYYKYLHQFLIITCSNLQLGLLSSVTTPF
jgi:hypothetical protein